MQQQRIYILKKMVCEWGAASACPPHLTRPQCWQCLVPAATRAKKETNHCGQTAKYSQTCQIDAALISRAVITTPLEQEVCINCLFRLGFALKGSQSCHKWRSSKLIQCMRDIPPKRDLSSLRVQFHSCFISPEVLGKELFQEPSTSASYSFLFFSVITRFSLLGVQETELAGTKLIKTRKP